MLSVIPPGQTVVPDLKDDVRKKLEDTREELRNLGDGLPITEEGRQGVLLDVSMCVGTMEK